MPKYNITALLSLALLAAASPAHANPISTDLYGGTTHNPLFLAVTFSALLVEYLVVRRLLRPYVRLRHLLPAFLVVNIVSFPITFLLGTFVSLLAEAFPLYVEPLLYDWYFENVKVTPPKIRARVVAANLISFAFGLVAYHITLPWT